jgi:hypothetical protein
MLVGSTVGGICMLTSCAPLSNTVIALSIMAILLRFPFNRMPSNEIWASTISPTRMVLGLISLCLNCYFHLYSDTPAVRDSPSSPSFLTGFIILHFIVFCMHKLFSHRLREYVVRVNGRAK